MTRRKWNRLRRQRPEPFKVLPPFENWNDFERDLMRKVSKAEALAVMTAWKLRGESGPVVAGLDRIPF